MWRESPDVDVYLFDTNVLSEVIRRRPHAGLIRRLARVPAEVQFTSCICVMELRYGSRRRQDHAAFWDRIVENVLSRVAVLPVTVEEAMLAGDVAAGLSLRGVAISPEDLLIGATALAKEMTLITANTRHFERIPRLRVENWLQ